MKILIGVTGSVAAIKIPELVEKLLINPLLKIEEIALVPTEKSLKFFKEADIPNSVKIWKDEDEWTMWNKRNDPVLHIDLVKWADCLLLSPLDANTLAKISNGICDNLLTSLLRAWDLKSGKPVIFCPAMNTKMWEHPLTLKQIDILKSFGYIYVEPIEKVLMCGDKGVGAMAEVDSIINVLVSKMSKIVAEK